MPVAAVVVLVQRDRTLQHLVVEETMAVLVEPE
jgi:hypothetical protein